MFIRSSEESLKLRNSSFLAQDRMDNLLKAHTYGAVTLHKPGRGVADGGEMQRRMGDMSAGAEPGRWGFWQSGG
jgi:hypothetical protein